MTEREPLKVTNLDRYGNTSAASVPIALDEALESNRFRSELSGVKGQLLLLKDPSCVEQAEESFRFAIDGARKRSMNLLELRVTTHLARLVAWQGRRNQARSMLSEVYR